MALVEARGTAAACFSISSHHPRHAMGYHQHPYGGASGSGRPTTNSPAAQLDDVVFDYLLPDDESVVRHPPAPGAPGTLFGTTTPPPPRRLPVEQLVVAPDAAGYYGHAAASSSRSAAAESPTMMRTERIAFRMRSDEEVLDDGYKWRKYGKKSVKNSPNPRNYYRCSTEGCNVKKRVERDRDDPRYVVTMYEGVHNHVAPGTVYYAAQDAASGRFFVAGMHHPGP